MLNSTHLYEKENFGKLYNAVSRKALANQLFKPVILVGEKHTIAVNNALPGGFTYQATPSIATLNDSIAGSAVRMSVNPSPLYLVHDIEEEFIRRTSGASAEDGNERAFASARLSGAKLSKDSLILLNDIMTLFYRGDDVGQFESDDSVGIGSPTLTGVTLTIDSAHWIPGLKSMMGHKFDVYNASHTKIVDGGVLSGFTQSTRKLALTCTATEAAACITASPASPFTGYLVPVGHPAKNATTTAPGLKKYLSTTSGTFLGADFSDPNLQGVNLPSVAGPLTELVVYSALTECTNAQGIGPTEFVLLTSTASHGDVLASFDADTRYEGGGTKTWGTRTALIEFGDHKVSFISSSCIKQGDAFLVPLRYIKRVRSHTEEVAYSGTNMHGGVPFIPLQDKPGQRIRASITECLLVAVPNACAYIPGINPTLGN